MSNLRYGVIGCGMMGQEHLQNIALLDGAEVGAVFEPNAEMSATAQSLAPTAVMAESFEALLDVPGLDALLIASPNFRHADQMMQIAAKRPLPMLVEKPLFTTPADAARMQNLMKSYPAPIWVAMEYRYMPPIAALLAEADAVTGGVTMLTIREHRFPFLEKIGDWNRFNRYTGGTFVEKCCHFFDLMRLVMGGEPVRVMASAGQAVNHLDEDYDGAQPDILDHGYVIVEFSEGRRAMLELCMFAEGSEYQEEVSAVGAKGKIEALVPGPSRFWPSDLGAAPTPKLIKSPRAPKRPEKVDVPVPEALLAAGDHNGSTFYQHQQFQKLMTGEIDAPEVSLNDGWMAVVMGMAAQQSAMSGEVVHMDRFCADLVAQNTPSAVSA